MKISVLIATVPPRHNVLNELLKGIARQSPQSTEFVICSDDFRCSVGDKRNKLIEASSGEFVVFLDDDDQLHPCYFEILNRVLFYKNVDYVGYRMSRVFDGKKQLDEYRSIRYKKCFDDEFGSYRHISHTNPIRRSIASQFLFPSISRGEDDDWCNQIFLSNFVIDEFFLNLPMYEQRFNSRNSTSQGSIKKDGSITQLKVPYGLLVKEIGEQRVFF